MCRGSGHRGLCKGLSRDVLFNVQGGFSEGGEPPGIAAALGLQREIHHAHIHAHRAGRRRGSILLPKGGKLFFFSSFFLTSYRLSVPH